MAEFVVVGGGIYGTLTARELALAGADTVLLEANHIAGGASGGLGKRGVRANGRDARELPFMREAYAKWPSLGDELGADTGYERLGQLQLVERERDVAPAMAQLWMQNRLGIETEWLGANAVREREPDIEADIEGALLCPNDGVADHTATTQAAGDAARRLGVDVREQTAMRAVQVTNGNITHIETSNDESIAVSRGLLLLANAAVPPLLAEHFNCALPVWAVLPQVMETQPVSQPTIRHLVGHSSRVLSIKPHRDRVMISGGWRGRWNNARGVGETTPDQVSGNFNEAIAVYPSLATTSISRATADRPESASVDGIPIIDRIPGVANGIFATGWCGHGWAIAPTIANHLARWALGGRPSALLRPFGLARFDPP
ncbi:MAG: FAD-binding oxidoreductase [Pseudomonadota bacterium]